MTVFGWGHLAPGFMHQCPVTGEHSDQGIRQRRFAKTVFHIHGAGLTTQVEYQVAHFRRPWRTDVTVLIEQAGDFNTINDRHRQPPHGLHPGRYHLQSDGADD